MGLAGLFSALQSLHTHSSESDQLSHEYRTQVLRRQVPIAMTEQTTLLCAWHGVSGEGGGMERKKKATPSLLWLRN